MATLGVNVKYVQEGINEIHNATLALGMMEIGKQYLLSAGRHTAVVKKTENGFEYPDDLALDYHNLESVHNGTEAMGTFTAMAAMTPEEPEISRAQLLQYCGLDAYAMVTVWEELAEAAK